LDGFNEAGTDQVRADGFVYRFQPDQPDTAQTATLGTIAQP
jgi:hypothetical protein